jgi:predicted nuclease of restriction endonuclease-like (RecB) superfamily
MSKPKRKASAPAPPPDALFGRVASILDQARGHVVRAVNTQMVLAYWLIGREIVEEFQQGKGRATYGDKLLKELSIRLVERYGAGFSVPNLKNFRRFYQIYADRCSPIGYPPGSQFHKSLNVSDSGEEPKDAQNLSPPGRDLLLPQIRHPAGAESPAGFSPQLTWSHYRALMRVDDPEARAFYEREAIAGGWDKRTLERQIQSFFYERTLKSSRPAKLLAEGRKLPTTLLSPVETLKNPYVLEFLGLPDVASFHESDLERAIITHLQRFLLELGSGFAFVARQKHLRIEEQDRYIDLVFYHCRLKFYLLIDLKVDELTHADVGQMDGYVRLYDGLFVAPDDNPTIGLILCTEKNETVARYSVLNDRKQIFASKYMLCLPTEEQLRREIERERRLIEATHDDE